MSLMLLIPLSIGLAAPVPAAGIGPLDCRDGTARTITSPRNLI